MEWSHQKLKTSIVTIHSEQQNSKLNNFRLFLGFHLQSQKKEPPGEANETVA